MLPYWESIEPVPLPAEIGVEPDPRRARTDLAVDFMGTAMPHFALMHEMTTDHVHEEVQLLANDFSSMIFETIGHVPGWRDHYLAHDQTPHYEHLRTQLKAMQFLRGGRRWLLKSPQHLEQLPVLERVFPGLTVVVTHRDPVPVALSMVMMICYTARMHRSPVDVREIAAFWADRLERMLAALVRDRDAIPAERSIDITLRRVHGRRPGRRREDLRAGGGAADRPRPRPPWPTTSPATSAAGWAGWPPAARCSVSTRPTSGAGSRRTSSGSWPEARPPTTGGRAVETLSLR